MKLFSAEEYKSMNQSDNQIDKKCPKYNANSDNLVYQWAPKINDKKDMHKVDYVSL